MLFYWKLLLILNLLNLSNGHSVRLSLAVVVDVQSNKVDLLCEELSMLLDKLYQWPSSIFYNYILLQPNENVLKVPVTTNHSIIKIKLNDLKTNHWVDREMKCDASGYQALYNGLPLAEWESTFLVFSDGGTKNQELLSEIKRMTKLKTITTFFSLSNNCDQSNTSANYRDIVAEYDGDVFDVDYTNLKTHFELLAKILTGPPKVPSIEVIVDSTMTEFILTISGLNAMITMFDNDGKYVSSKRYNILTDLPTVKMIKVPDPMPGRYTIGITSETSYTGQVQTKSDLQFEYGFSVHEPSEMWQTNYAPLQGRNTYLVISPSNTSLIDNLYHVVLFTSYKKYAYKLHQHSIQGARLFLTEPFPSPSESFKIQLYGRDRQNFPISRLISTLIDARSAEIPMVETNSKITVHEGEEILLICRAYSMINVTVQWSKRNSTLKSTELNQSGGLNYTIVDSHFSDSGEYSCTVENSRGKSESKSIVTVEKSQLVVHTPVKSVDTEAGTLTVELKCVILPNIKNVKTLWLYNGKPEVPKGAEYNQSNLILFNIDRHFDGRYTCVGQKGADENRDSVQLNVKYPPNIRRLFISKTNTSIGETLKITVNLKKHIICDYESFPEPTVQWISSTGVVVSNTSDLSLSSISESDEYSCQVENQMGKASRTVKIIVADHETNDVWSATDLNDTFTSGLVIEITDNEFSRTLEPSEHEIEITNKTNLVLMCTTNEVPALSIQWKNNGKVMSTTNKLAIPSSILYDSDVYECSTTDRINILKRALTIKQITIPTVMLNYNTSIKLVEGISFALRCPIDIGHYNISWTLNGVSIDNFKLSDGTIYIDSVNENMKGVVLCVASNKAGTVNAKFIFDVLRSPYDLVVEKLPNINPIETDRYEIKCSAKGRPEPNIYWIKDGIYFKHGNSVQFDKLQSTSVRKYACFAENRLGIANETIMLEDFSPKQPPFDIMIQTPGDMSPTINQPFEIRCSVKGNPKPNVLWLKNGKLFKRGDLVTFHTFQRENAGEYRCIASNDFGEEQTILILQDSFVSNVTTPFTNSPDPNIAQGLEPTINILIFAWLGKLLLTSFQECCFGRTN